MDVAQRDALRPQRRGIGSATAGRGHRRTRGPGSGLCSTDAVPTAPPAWRRTAQRLGASCPYAPRPWSAPSTGQQGRARRLRQAASPTTWVRSCRVGRRAECACDAEPPQPPGTPAPPAVTVRTPNPPARTRRPHRHARTTGTLHRHLERLAPGPGLWAGRRRVHLAWGATPGRCMHPPAPSHAPSIWRNAPCAHPATPPCSWSPPCCLPPAARRAPCRPRVRR